MRIQPIVNHTAFNGLLGPRKFVETQSIQGDDCDYYRQYYHPFADESEKDIERRMLELEQEINPNPEHSQYSGVWTSVKRGHSLTLTTADYNAILKGKATNHLLLLTRQQAVDARK